jgi:hypothetical protein
MWQARAHDFTMIAANRQQMCIIGRKSYFVDKMS